MKFKRREEMTQADKNYNRIHDPIILMGWIKEIWKNQAKLTMWELSFLQSMTAKLNFGKFDDLTLSDPEIVKLEEIYSKV